MTELAGKEFVPFPEKFSSFVVEPAKEIKLAKEVGATTKLTLTNQGKIPVLYKVKCTNNSRIGIPDCAGVLTDGKTAQVELKRKQLDEKAEDRICVVYTLMGDNGGENALVQWRRAIAQQIPTKSIVLKVSEASKN
uniref:Major sperm protein n=1 Tax=Panagrolaimus sp. JU765 TaxID=591449 RepID=A0AC34QXQ9_9BILA